MRILFFFFNDTATTEIYTLSLHDALPILQAPRQAGITRQDLSKRLDLGREIVLVDNAACPHLRQQRVLRGERPAPRDRKSTRLNSSHANISYAVFCLKKKKKHNKVNEIG